MMNETLQEFVDKISKLKRYVVLDVETTGLKDPHICQVAIVDQDGDVLLDTLVKPVGVAITPAATALHGITDAMVANAKRWDAHVDIMVSDALAGETCFMYNAAFDLAAMQNSTVAPDRRAFWNTATEYIDVMAPFAEVFGEWNNYFKNYKWQKLATAARFYGIEQSEAHSALADCRTTLAVIQHMLNST